MTFCEDFKILTPKRNKMKEKVLLVFIFALRDCHRRVLKGRSGIYTKCPKYGRPLDVITCQLSSFEIVGDNFFLLMFFGVFWYFFDFFFDAFFFLDFF
jgi:hypothetical protein